MFNKKPENKIELILNNNISSLSVFKDTKFIFLYKKTEKIVTAIYLITNLLRTEEPIKWQLRKCLLETLDSVIIMGNSAMSDMDCNVRNLSLKLFQVITLFDVAYRAGFVSEMNYQLVHSELVNVSSFLVEYQNRSDEYYKGHLIKDDFFSIKNNLPKDSNKNIKDNIKDINKGQVIFNKKIESDKSNIIKDIENNFKTNDIGQKRVEIANKSNRRDKILDIIKQKTEVSVKDISDIIKDTSEKTIQRELLAMVEEKILDKKGERRWSRYSVLKTD